MNAGMSGRSTADVVVVGDGPAGSALATALAAAGTSVVLVGRDDPWNATYGTYAPSPMSTMKPKGPSDSLARPPSDSRTTAKPPSKSPSE